MSDARDRSTSLDIEILGEGVFHEVGRPDLVVTTPDLVAVSGSFGTYGTGPLQWNGHLVRRIPGDPGLNRIGLYERFSLRCLHVVPSRWPVTCLAFDRGATRLAVGTGRYDGGLCYEGELLLLDTFSGSVASLLPHRREVLAVTWADDRTIEVVLSPFSDESTEGTTRHRIPVPPSGSFDEAPETADLTSGIPVDPPLRSSGDGEVALTRLTTGHRLRYEARRLVWDVEIDDDGGVLAALDGIRLEAWSPAGELRYQMPTPDIGCQILPFGDRVVTVTGRPTGTPIEGTQVAIHDRADGAVIREVPHPVGLAGGAGGGLVLLRDTSLAGRRSEPDRSLLLDPADGATGEVAVGGFSSFPVRRAPELLLLVGDTGRDRHRNKYVAHLPPPEPDAPTEPERLYPLDWEQEGRILRIRT